jgi:hypothetical protein
MRRWRTQRAVDPRAPTSSALQTSEPRGVYHVLGKVSGKVFPQK